VLSSYIGIANYFVEGWWQSALIAPLWMAVVLREELII